MTYEKTEQKKKAQMNLETVSYTHLDVYKRQGYNMRYFYHWYMMCWKLYS